MTSSAVMRSTFEFSITRKRPSRRYRQPQGRIRMSQKRQSPLEVRMPHLWRILLTLLFLVFVSSAQETHSHSAPEKLGKVSFPTSCTPSVQEQFDRAVALLHSFAYTAAENAFQGVAELDRQWAMAHWGMAMAYFHQ